MTRRNRVRSLRAAALLAISVATGVLMSAPADAHHFDFTPDFRVKVYDTYFDPPLVSVGRGQTVQFDLQPGASVEHTVTLEHGECESRPDRQCDLGFRDPDHPPVYRFFTYGEYPYYSRLARARGDLNMRGRIVVNDTPPPSTVPPSSTTTTTGPTTTTTTPATTTTTASAPTTTTTAPGTIRPLVIADPAPTSTTTTALPPPSSTTGAPAAPTTGKQPEKDRGKGRSREAAPTTSTTGAPAPTGSVPLDVVFDPAYLTPGPVALPATPASESPDEAALDAATVVNLLDPGSDEDDAGGRLALYALGGLALIFVIGAIWGWQHRSSRYFPA